MKPLHIGIVGDGDFSHQRLFNKTLESVQGTNGPLVLRVNNERNVLLELVRSYVRHHPDCRMELDDALNDIGNVGKYQSIVGTGNVLTKVHHAICFTRGHDHLTPELLRLAEQDGVTIFTVLADDV